MKVLFVAMADCVHTAKWISQLSDTGWEIYLFPAYDKLNIHEQMPDHVKVCLPYYRTGRVLTKLGLGKLFKLGYYYNTLINNKIHSDYYARRLSKTIKRIKPDLIHSLETQGAGYLVESARQKILQKGAKWPRWWHSNWGSDIVLYGRLKEHQPLIRAVMQSCDYYSCECQRDVKLAHDFGFTGEVFPVYPSAGGFHGQQLDLLRTDAIIPSKRKVIMLKGYQSWYGRALVGIRSLERCADVLKGYSIILYTNIDHPIDVEIAAKLFHESTGIDMQLLPPGTPNEDILRYHSSARLSIGLCTCDGISTSVLEAMAMGSFPIQSNTSCADEWIVDGETGLLVPPEDPEIIEQAIRQALSDDELVDNAARVNWIKIRQDADYEKLKKLTLQSYNHILSA